MNNPTRIVMLTAIAFILIVCLCLGAIWLRNFFIWKRGTWTRISGQVISHKPTRLKKFFRACIIYQMTPYDKKTAALTVAMTNPPPVSKKKIPFDMVTWKDRNGKTKTRIYTANPRAKTSVVHTNQPRRSR